MMQDLLTKYTLLAKHVIYDPKRMAVLANMLQHPGWCRVGRQDRDGRD